MSYPKNKVTILDGEIYTDHRGTITSLNNFRFDDVERTYFIHHPDVSVIRGWHAHQFEKKWFYCIKGSFTIAFVEIDDWKNPSLDLKPQVFEVTDKKSQIICVPQGYANCLKANENHSILMVLSGKILEEALLDSWRYDSSMWGVNWNEK